jgi:hypothetical protein
VSSEGFFVRFLLGLLGSLAVVALAVGWTVSNRTVESHVLAAGGAEGSWATSSELVWLGRLGAWDTRLLRGLQLAAQPELGRARAEKTEPAGSCTTDLERKVGPAPTARLRHALDVFALACVHLERFHSAATQGSVVPLAQREANRAASLLLQGDQMLPPGEVRSLPVIGGVAAVSRVEPRFGRVASALAGKQVEVRCWSKADWQRLMREESVYTQGKLGADTLGFAGIGASRINLAPSVCDSLLQLAYRHARPSAEAGRLSLAAAVVTLSHEPAHSRGIADEAVAECQALQLANGTALKLGASPAYAASLVREYWSHYGEELPAYRSTECRPGGKLDLGNASSIW